MLSGFASNSILAVIRTKYGACLTERNFRDMSALHSVPEVADYLASRTRYGEAVSGLDLSGINRLGLERALRNFLLDEIYDVCRFEKSVGENMFTCIIRRLEITELREMRTSTRREIIISSTKCPKLIFRDCCLQSLLTISSPASTKVSL